jgi:diadenosine tetraphosphatase ApaH/serine/threonine PP2A family protein phosphatase
MERQEFLAEMRFDHTKSFVFMGDYVDRGYHSLNTFLYLACLKVEYPQSIYLLRGNHETRQVSARYGLLNECILNYGHSGIWTLCNEAFDLLPIAALVDKDVFCVHGGLSPDIRLLEQLSLLDRQVEIPSSGPLCDLLWSDPEEGAQSYVPSSRGGGYLFGKTQTTIFTRCNRLAFIARSHQLAQRGYATYFGSPEESRGYRLVTVWSAPNYTYRAGNAASVLGLRFPEEDPQNIIIFGAAPQPIRMTPPDEESYHSGGQYFA